MKTRPREEKGSGGRVRILGEGGRLPRFQVEERGAPVALMWKVRKGRGVHASENLVVADHQKGKNERGKKKKTPC